MKVVKVSCPSWGYPVDLAEIPFLRQSPNRSGIWEDFEFVINQEIDSCDYWVVFDQILKEETCKCPPENTIFITGEPQGQGIYPKVFLDQFAHVISCHRGLNHTNVHYSLSGHPWFVDKSYDEILDSPGVEKTKCISLITTKKNRARYEAALQLKEYFGDKLDLFGIGINPVVDKWDALAPYKYTIVMENCRQVDWITEKLFDPYLSLTYPFYYGAPNILSYYPENAFVEIDISALTWTVWCIERCLKEPNHYQNLLPSLSYARDLTLNKYNFFPLITSFLKENLCQKSKKSQIVISDKGRFLKNTLMFLAKKGIL